MAISDIAADFLQSLDEYQNFNVSDGAARAEGRARILYKMLLDAGDADGAAAMKGFFHNYQNYEAPMAVARKLVAKSAPSNELLGRTPIEEAIFNILPGIDSPLPGRDIIAKLARTGVSIDAPALSRACKSDVMKAWGVRNRRGAGYYKIAIKKL